MSYATKRNMTTSQELALALRWQEYITNVVPRRHKKSWSGLHMVQHFNAVSMNYPATSNYVDFYKYIIDAVQCPNARFDISDNSRHPEFVNGVAAAKIVVDDLVAGLQEDEKLGR